MAKDKVEKDGKEKKDRKDKKDGTDKDKKKGVTFVHERLTEPPPPRYPVGQEPPLPPWPITWTSIGICLESSVPGLSTDIVAENFNKLARPCMSMVVVHPKDLAEDEMAIDGTVLAEMLKKAKEESNASWPPSNLLDKCLKSRSVLDRDNEHRNEEVRRTRAVVEAKLASEDFKAKLAVAKEEVKLAETKLRDYKTKLREEMRARKAERKLVSKAARKVDAAEICETELNKGRAKQNESKDKKVEDKDKREAKVGKKQDQDKPGDEGEKCQKRKAGEGEPEPLLPIVSPQDQFQLYEEDVTNKIAFVKELEAKLLGCVETEATLSSTLLKPFTTGRLYCIIGMDSALPVIQLACEDTSFFKAIFIVAPRPKDTSISPSSEGTDKARDDDVPGLTSSSNLTDSKMEKKASKKEAKLAKKEAKAAAGATAIPPLVAEIKAVVKNGSIMDPARSLCVVDVFYEVPLPAESHGDGGESKKQEEEVKKQKGEGGDKRRKEEGRNKNEKKVKGRKEDKDEVGDKGDEEKVETKSKKSETTKKAVGTKDESLPYGQVAQAVVFAVQCLQLQVQLYSAMGGNKVKIFKVPEAKPIQEEDRRYYNHLLNEFPQGLVTVPLIVHCLLEQVASYQWPIDETKAIETENLNKKIRHGVYREFEKLGHPKWIGVEGDIGEGLPTRFEGPFNAVHTEAKAAVPPQGTTNNDVVPGANGQAKIVDAPILNLGGDEIKTSTAAYCDLHRVKTVTCAIHKFHIDGQDEPLLRKGQTIKVYDPYVQAKELEDKLHVTHEFDTITQPLMILKPSDIDVTVNATKVRQHLSMLRATPARSRYKMPGTPMYSEEKMGASLTALQDLCNHYQEDQRKFQSLEDALFHCKDLMLSNRVDINAMQRYQKLSTFLEMIKQDKDVFPELDIPTEETPESDNMANGPYNLEEMKYWCSNCLAFFKHPDVVEERPKDPLTDKERNRLKKMFETKLVKCYEKRQLDKDQPLNQKKGESNPVHEDEFDQEMNAFDIFSKGIKEEQVQNEASFRRELDPRVVKMWCAGCQSVFLPPPPPTLKEIWNEGKRIREEMDRLAARDAQAVADAKIEAWKRLEQNIRKSIIGRQHAEGFADGLMGEVYARAKLHLPFEIIKYDHDEDCILTCLYAANTHRNVQEQIPCLMQFGDFCTTYDLASGEPIKKKFVVYEMEPQYKLVLDERRYLLTEQQGLVICGLPAKSPVQYEPRATIYKDGNVIMLRAIKAQETSGKVQEESDIKKGFDFGKDRDQRGKGKTAGGPLGTEDVVLRKKIEEEGDVSTTTGKKEGNNSLSKKEATRKDKMKRGKEEIDISDSASGVVQKQAKGDATVSLDLLNEKQGLVGFDPLSPSDLECERCVIACLKDGLIVTFFFAKDATLHLQVNIPDGGRTFEITSNGEVIFLPLDVQKQEPKPAMDISTSLDSPARESTEIMKQGETKISNREVQSPPKGKTIGNQSNQKKTEGTAGADGKLGVKLKKKNGKAILDKSEKGNNRETDGHVEPGKRGDEGQLLSDLELINGLCKKGAGDMEVSRCILPSGTVVSYKENGSLQILFNNGNMSERKINSEDTVGWVTTNNKGFCVLQGPPTTKPTINDEVSIPEDTIATSKHGKGKNKKTEKEKNKDAEWKEQEAKLEKDPKTKNAKTGQDTRQNGAKQDKKVVSFAEKNDVSMGNLEASNPNPATFATESCHVQLPHKKVLEIFDPDSGSSIMTREDLVVVIYTNDNTVRLVQHADGTHIYSEVQESIQEYNPSVGQISLDRTKEFNSSTKVNPKHQTSVDSMTSIPPPSIKSEIDPPSITCFKIGGDNESNLATASCQQINSGVQLATEIFHAKKRLYSTQWHVRKEGFPSVHGSTNGGVAVEFITTDGEYCATWSRESGNISILLPNGSMIYSCGKLVNFDASDGTKRSDPKHSFQNQPAGGPSLINTNGIYEFNLEKAKLTFTNNSGNGFQSTWGYNVELITNGVLQRPKKLIDPLSEVPKSPDIGENSISIDEKKKASIKAVNLTINSLVPASINNNKDSYANATGRSKTLKVQHIQASQVGPPLSPISKRPTFDYDLSPTMTDARQVSESSTAGQQPSVCGNEETNETEEPILGPTTRLFVIHEGGFGFEIIHENEFNKYTSSKKWSKDSTHTREVYEEASAILHTFVTVEQKAKKLAEVFVQPLESCRAPDVLKIWTTKFSEIARRIKLRAIETKLQKRTKCDWLQINLNLPYLPRVVSPELLPTLPLSNMTKVVFRQIFEYLPFQDEQIPRMDRILKIYNKWQENAMILTDVEQNPDTRTKEEIKQAQDVAKTIREGCAEKKLLEAKDRAAVEVQHAKEIFREMMNVETKRLQSFEERRDKLRKTGESDMRQYKDCKKGPLPCVHKPCNNLQINGPCRPDAHVRLCYFECEEGLQYIISLQYQQWQQHPEDPRQWSMEALPPFSCSYQGSGTSTGSGEQDAANSGYETPSITPLLKEEMVPNESLCLLSEWMREGKMCWELIKPKRKELGPADWTPCFLIGFDEKCEESDTHLGIDLPEIKEARPDPTVEEEVAEEPYVKAEKIGAEVPLPDIEPFWSIPTGKEWEINHEAVQRQSELIPNFPGWHKAGWHKNKNYLDINFGTLPCAKISSIGTLRKRPRPPKDWSRQFLLVPNFLDFGTVEYGTISMKVIFLQNYHGTEPGRFRFENLSPSVKLLCELGMLPPGLSRAIRIFFRASALGNFNHEIRILTQYDVFEVPLFAKVVLPKNY